MVTSIIAAAVAARPVLDAAVRASPPARQRSLTVGFGVGGTAWARALVSLSTSLTANPLSMSWNGRPRRASLTRLGLDDEGRRSCG